MRRSLAIIIILLLFIPFYSIGQKKVRKTELRIGDKLPDIEFTKLINHPKGSIRVSDFKGKALLLDFWAPWCTPCITAFPKLNSLQVKFKDKLQVIPVTADSKDYSQRSLRHLEKINPAELPMSVVEDTIASGLFQFRVLPHYVWIDRNGIVKAITGSESVTENNLQNLIDGAELALPVKVDDLIVPEGRPLIASNRVRPEIELIVAHSVLTKYIQGIVKTAQRGKNWIDCTNHSIMLLYKIAFGEMGIAFINDNRVILEGFNTQSDSLMIGRYTTNTKNLWQEISHDNLYTYELVVPDSTLAITQLFKYMQDDLNRMFAKKGIQGRIEKRNVKSLVLIRTTQEDNLKSAGGTPKDLHSDNFLEIRNKYLYAFSMKFEGFYYKRDSSLPFFDDTDYRNKVDMQINADLRDIPAVNKELEKYGLQIVEKERETDMIIITKKAP